MNSEKQMNKIRTQSIEFDALEELTKQWEKLKRTAIVDDSYPAARHNYERALEKFIEALKTNGRI